MLLIQLPERETSSGSKKYTSNDNFKTLEDSLDSDHLDRRPTILRSLGQAIGLDSTFYFITRFPYACFSTSYKHGQVVFVSLFQHVEFFST